MPCAFILSEGSERIGARPRLHARILILHMIRIFATMLAALTGLAFGSFLNVCVTRWPAGESVVTPRSHCRSCARTLAWWENIPVVSWLALRGRCRTCGASISWRYPLVELALAVLWGITAWRYLDWILTPDESTRVIQFAAAALVVAKLVLYWLLVALAVLDAENLWLPDWLTLPGTILGFSYSLLPYYLIDRVPLFGIQRAPVSRLALTSMLAIAISVGLILMIRWGYWLIRRREGMGLGDAKLMAMLGAWLGLPGALLSFVIGVVLATIAAFGLLALPAARRGSESWIASKLPLGTFLCIGGIFSALWG